MAVTGLPVGWLSLLSQGNLLTLSLLKLVQQLAAGNEKAFSNEQTLAKAKPASAMGAKKQRVHGRHLGVVPHVVNQLVKLPAKPSPALVLE